VEKVLDLEPDTEPEPVEAAGVGKIAGWGRIGEP
jgi:hypothetical protein